MNLLLQNIKLVMTYFFILIYCETEYVSKKIKWKVKYKILFHILITFEKYIF